MTSFNESDINRSSDGKFAPKSTTEASVDLDTAEDEIVDSIRDLEPGQSVTLHHPDFVHELTVCRDDDRLVASMRQDMHIEPTPLGLADVQRFVRNKWGAISRPDISTDSGGSYRIRASVDFPLERDPSSLDDVRDSVYRSSSYEPYGSRSASQVKSFVEAQDGVVAQARSHPGGSAPGMDDAVRDWAAGYANQEAARRGVRGFVAANSGSTSEGLNPMERAVFDQAWNDIAAREAAHRRA